MKNKFKIIILVFLVLGQIIIYRYAHPLKLNLDLFYLIMVYISVMSGFYKSIATGFAIGLITDYFSGNIMGVFGFSRTISAFFLNEISRRIDLKNNLFVFLMISVSLAFSNFISNVFLYYILGFSFNIGLLIYQPISTGLIGLLISSSKKAKEYMDVY